MSRADPFARIAAIERGRGQRVGASHVADEPLRFLPSTSLSFAARDIEPSPDASDEWVTTFLGLAGADGALPPYLAEEIAREDSDRPLRSALLAPFHHRATALLYRSVHRCRIPDETQSRADIWPTRLSTMVGGDASQGTAEREIAVVLAPLLHGRPSAASLARALRVIARRWLADAPISLTERTGSRVEIDVGARARLGGTRLGDTALLGSTIADPASRATITIGPCCASAAASLSPGGTGYLALAQVARRFGDSATEIDVVVRSIDTPLRIGGARLGRSALGRGESRIRGRHLHLDATPATAGRQAHYEARPARPTKELSCEPTPDRSSSA